MKMKLLCIPYSGGSASIYYQWFQSLNSSFELYPLELGGHPSRYVDPLPQSVQEAAYDVFTQLPQMTLPYAIFGYSLGCLITYELISLLKRYAFPLPSHVFLAASAAPHNLPPRTELHLLPDHLFLKELSKMGGIKSSFLENKELQRIFLPILRSDYKMYEGYKPLEEISLFPCDITIFSGSSDHLLASSDLNDWSIYTSHRFRMILLDGGHFFIEQNKETVGNFIREILCQMHTH